MGLDNGSSTQIASDVGERDGLGLELIHESTGGEVWAEVFCDDSDKTLLVRVITNRPLPYGMVRQWLADGENLLPFMPGRDEEQEL